MVEARSSVDGRLLAPADEALGLEREGFVAGGPPGAGAIHVRVWSGQAWGQLRTVVLLGETAPSKGFVATLRTLVDTVARHCLSCPGHEAAWFLYSPTLSEQWVETVAVTWHGGPESCVDARSDPADLAILESALGRPVERFPGRSYTEETVQLWREAKVPVPVVRDDQKVGEALTALGRFDAAARGGPHVDLARWTCRAMASVVRERLGRIDAQPWDDGTGPDDDGRPQLFAAYEVPPIPTPEQSTLLERWSEPLPGPSASDLDRWLSRLRQMEGWHLEVDEFADHPEPGLDAALRVARSAVRTRITWADPQADVDEWGPAPTVLWGHGRLDRRYLDAVSLGDRTPDTRGRRVVAEAIAHIRTEPLFGEDPWLHTVAIDDGSNSVGHYVVEWPRRWSGGIPDGAEIVAERDPGRGGPVAAFVVVGDELCGLLPRPHGLRQWSFGGGGSGGTSNLIDDIERFVTMVFGCAVPEHAHRWLVSQVAERGTRMSVSVDRLRELCREPDEQP